MGWTVLPDYLCAEALALGALLALGLLAATAPLSSAGAEDYEDEPAADAEEEELN